MKKLLTIVVLGITTIGSCVKYNYSQKLKTRDSMKKLLLIGLIVPFLSFANPEFEKKIDTCKSLSSSTQRLNCYDAIFEKKIEIQSDYKNMGKWIVKEDVSPIDDSKTVTLVLEADTPIKVRHNQSTPYLVIRCQENRTELYIGFNTFLGTDTIRPTTRIDSEKAVSLQEWKISTDHKAIFYNGNVKIMDFLKELQNKNKYFIQITPYSESPVNTTFTLTGLDLAIKPLQEACGW